MDKDRPFLAQAGQEIQSLLQVRDPQLPVGTVIWKYQTSRHKPIQTCWRWCLHLTAQTEDSSYTGIRQSLAVLWTAWRPPQGQVIAQDPADSKMLTPMTSH